MDQELKQVYDTVHFPLYQESYDIYPNGNESIFSGITYQHYLNCFPTVTKSNLENALDSWVSKRNGFYTTTFDFSTILSDSISNWAVDNITFSQLNNTYVCAVFDETNSKHVIISYDGNNTFTKIGEITGTSSTDHVFLSELTIENTPYLGVVWHDTLGFLSSVSKGFYAATTAAAFTASSLTEITDVDFPPNQTPAQSLRGPMVQIDATTYVLTLEGIIYGSDLNSISSWNALNALRAIQYPDHGVSLARYKHHLVVFGEDSIEFFNDVGNPPPSSPLERTQQAFIKFGAGGPRLITTVGDTLYWISNSSNETASLYKLDGYTPIKISTNTEENIMGLGVNELRPIFFMNNQCLITDCMVDLAVENMANKHASTYVDGASTSSLFTSDPSGTFSDEFTKGLLAWNLESKTWWVFKHSYASVLGTALMPIGTVHASSSVLQDLGQYTYVLMKNVAGGIPSPIAYHVYSLLSYSQGLANFQDQYYDIDSTLTLGPITCSIATNTELFGTEKQKRIHKLKVIQRIPQTTVNTYPLIWLVYFKDDFAMNTDTDGNKRLKYRSFQTSRDAIRCYLNNLGTGRQWGFVLVNRGNHSWQVKELELDMSQGTR